MKSSLHPLSSLLSLISSTQSSPSPSNSQNFLSCHHFSSPSPPFCSLFTISSSFHFDFSILFNFPSQYFSSIGLHILFRLRWNLPPLLWRIPNLHDSPMNDYLNQPQEELHVSNILSPWFPSRFTFYSSIINSFISQGHLEKHISIHLSFLPFAFIILNLHSPLLIQSLLISFLWVTNMLKFTQLWNE